MSINQKQRSWESEHSPQRRGAAALRGIGGAERQQNSNNFQKTSLCDPCKAVPWIQTELPIGVSLCCRHGGEARGFVTPDLRSALGHLGQLHASLSKSVSILPGAWNQPRWAGLHLRDQQMLWVTLVSFCSESCLLIIYTAHHWLYSPGGETNNGQLMCARSGGG